MTWIIPKQLACLDSEVVDQDGTEDLVDKEERLESHEVAEEEIEGHVQGTAAELLADVGAEGFDRFVHSDAEALPRAGVVGTVPELPVYLSLLGVTIFSPRPSRTFQRLY